MRKKIELLVASAIFRRWLVTTNEATPPFIQGLYPEAALESWWRHARQRLLGASNRRRARMWLVQSISLFRIFAILMFASLAFSGVPLILLTCLYAFAMVSDLLDGYLARKLGVATYFGKVLDLVADKSLTIVSLLYAAERGIHLLPLALIATRDIVMIGMRLVTVEGRQLLPTNRVFGGSMAAVLGINTLILMYAQTDWLINITNIAYWACALIFGANLLARLYASAHRIKTVSTSKSGAETNAMGRCRECGCTCELLSAKDSTSV